MTESKKLARIMSSFLAVNRFLVNSFEEEVARMPMEEKEENKTTVLITKDEVKVEVGPVKVSEIKVDSEIRTPASEEKEVKKANEQSAVDDESFDFGQFMFSAGFSFFSLEGTQKSNGALAVYAADKADVFSFAWKQIYDQVWSSVIYVENKQLVIQPTEGVDIRNSRQASTALDLLWKENTITSI